MGAISPADGSDDSDLPDPSTLPDKLLERDQWVCWETTLRDGRETKIPVDPHTGRRAKADDPSTWASFDTAHDHARETDAIEGLGFMFSADDLFVGVDLDTCRNPATGELADWANDIVQRLESFTEVSPSGYGLHIIVLAIKPGDRCRRKQDDTLDALSDLEKEPEIEMYDSGRFFTMTGQTLDLLPDEITQRNDALSDVFDEYIATTSESDDSEEATRSDTVVIPSDDAELLRRARRSEKGEKFSLLYDQGNWEAYGYPSQSEADQALANMLAFWTGCDRARMYDLMTSSALEREKYYRSLGDSSYLYHTIDEAIGFVDETYDPAHGQTEPPSAEPELDETEQWRNEAPPEDPETGDLSDDSRWDYIRTIYVDDETEDKVANQHAAQQLKREFEIAIKVETDEIFVYDPTEGIYEDDGESILGDHLQKRLGEQYTRQRHNEVLHKVRMTTSLRYRHEEFGPDEQEPVVAVDNGLLDLSELGDHRVSDPEPHLREFDPDYLLTSKLDVVYPEGEETPDPENFDAFLDDVLKSEEEQQTIYELIGYCLWPGYPFNKVTIMYGDGSNGKSTLLDVIRELLGGSENVSSCTMTELEEDTHAMANLDGKMANIAADLPDKKLETTGAVKSLSGGDAVTANPKFQDRYTFKNRAKLFFAANDPPEIGDESDAIYRRLMLINFPNQFTDPGEPGPDKRPAHELMAELTSDEELSAILAKAATAFADVMATGEFAKSGSIDEIREHYKKVSDPVYGFVSECLCRDEEEGLVGFNGIYAAYRSWCEENDAPIRSKQSVSQVLPQHINYQTAQERFNGTRQTVCYDIDFTPRGRQLAGLADEERDDQQAGL